MSLIAAFPNVPSSPSFGLFRAGYIYTLSDPDTGLVRYVGKTFNPNKRFYEHCNFQPRLSKRNKKNKWVYFLNKDSKMPIIDIIDDCDEFNWEEKEKSYIKLYKSFGADLLNMTDGGEPGSIGFKHTESARKRISEALKKRPFSLERNKNISEGKKRKYANDPEHYKHHAEIGAKALAKYRDNASLEDKLKAFNKLRVVARKKARFLFCDLVKVMIVTKRNSRPIKYNLEDAGMTPYDLDNLRRMYVKRRIHKKK